MQGFQREKWRIENNGHSAEVERVEKNHEMVGFSFFCGYYFFGGVNFFVGFSFFCGYYFFCGLIFLWVLISFVGFSQTFASHFAG